METDYIVQEIDWNDIRRLTLNILTKIKQQNLQIDTLVPVFRGGSVLALFLASNMKNVKTSCIHIKRSLTNTINAAFGDAKFLGVTNIEDITGKNILITEDTVDFGYSLDCAITELKKYKPKNIYVATLYSFNNDKYRDIIYGEYLDDSRWIVFPWEEELTSED